MTRSALLRVARTATESAGLYLKEHFYDLDTIVIEKPDNSVVTNHDYCAQKIISDILLGAFPGHTIAGEEDNGAVSGSDRVDWIVDPIDGTDNYVLKIPLFSAAVAACADEGTLAAAAVHFPITGQTIWADDQGNRSPSAPSTYSKPVSRLSDARVALIPAHRHRTTVPIARLRATLADQTRRLVDTWCPTLDWTLLAMGKLDAIIVSYEGNIDYDARIGEFIFRQFCAQYSNIELIQPNAFARPAYMLASRDRALGERLSDMLRKQQFDLECS